MGAAGTVLSDFSQRPGSTYYSPLATSRGSLQFLRSIVTGVFAAVIAEQISNSSR